jgi:hypothetical protein
LFETWPYQLPLTRIDTPSWVTALAALPKGALAGENGEPLSLYRQTLHHKPILRGYVSRLPGSLADRGATIQEMLHRGEFVQVLKRFDARYLLLHKFDRHRPVQGLRPVFLGDHHDLFVAAGDPLPGIEIPLRDCASAAVATVRIDSDDKGRPRALQIHAPADAGRVFKVGFSLAVSPPIDLPGDPRQIPLAADELFAEASAEQNALVTGHVGVLDAQGRGTTELHFATLARFADRTIHFSVAICDPRAPSGVCRITGQGSLRLRPR